MATSDEIRILGIDPGLNITGYGVIASSSGKIELVEAGVIRGGSSSKPLAERVRAIHQGVSEVIESLKPQTMGLEQLFSHYQRPKTAILMGHARGVIMLAAGQAKLPVTSYAATAVKKLLTGSGASPKLQIQQAIQRELRLDQLPEPADVADALAIALCHHFSQRSLAGQLK